MARALNIVLAEDEADSRDYLREVLTRLGHRVRCVATGPQLVELASAGEPDLVITDIKMPDLHGIEAAARLNEHRQVPVILVSGHHIAELLERAAVEYIMAYLVKPVKAADVAMAVAVAMARFGHYLQVRKEAADLRQALEDRKRIARAKGAVKKRLGVDAEQALRRMRRLANDAHVKLVEVARRVLEAEDVFGRLDQPPQGGGQGNRTATT
jgi:response regulator NasT